MVPFTRSELYSDRRFIMTTKSEVYCFGSTKAMISSLVTCDPVRSLAVSTTPPELGRPAPWLPSDRVRPVTEALEPGRAMTRFNTRLVTTFAALALALSAIGVYGLAAGEVA